MNRALQVICSTPAKQLSFAGVRILWGYFWGGQACLVGIGLIM